MIISAIQKEFLAAFEKKKYKISTKNRWKPAQIEQ